MAEFKPMVKMYTDEPSVILKLKKGGKVAMKKAGGHKSMSETMNPRMRGADEAFESESGRAPKKPSMMTRQKAMNPNLYKKGGNVVHKYDGGTMGMPRPTMTASPMAPSVSPPVNPPSIFVPPYKKGGKIARKADGGMMPMAPGAMPPVAAGPAMGRAALARLAPAARAARAAMLRRALLGMKKGGSTDQASIQKLEKELRHHESLPASKAHKASGGEIDAAETRTTLKGDVAKYARTKMDTARRDTSKGATGGVREGVPGGYKRGGRTKDCYAMGGSIEGNEGPYENTKMVTAGRGKTGGATGGVRMGNAGGFKRGGVMRKASGGEIDAKLTRTTVEGGNWENRPANTSKPGKTNTTTGEVKKANAGGYRRGGSASKKAYATGGNVVDDGKATKMPRHFVSRPVANNLQSGTFKRGGKVRRFEDGGRSDYYEDESIPLKIRNFLKDQDVEEMYREGERARTRQNLEDSQMIPNALRRAADMAGSLFSSSKPPAGSITKTEKSTTVTPAKKRGGRC